MLWQSATSLLLQSWVSSCISSVKRGNPSGVMPSHFSAANFKALFGLFLELCCWRHKDDINKNRMRIYWKWHLWIDLHLHPGLALQKGLALRSITDSSGFPNHWNTLEWNEESRWPCVSLAESRLVQCYQAIVSEPMVYWKGTWQRMEMSLWYI